MKKCFYLFSLIFSFLSFQFSNGQSIATYDITFTSVWNSSDHGAFPSNPHWSDLVGVTHNNFVTFFELGEIASLGIQNVAELGNNDEFMSEVNNAITNTHANQWFEQSFSNGALGSATLSNIEVSEDFPLLSLVSMIAPSPDWFIGLNSFSLLDMSNEWKTSVSIDMYPTDAGTDSGADYESPNNATTPQGVISSLQGVSPFNSNKIGTLTITLVSVLSTEDFSTNDKFKIFPNPTEGNFSISNIQNLSLNWIEIFNLNGKLLYEIQINNSDRVLKLNLESLKSGIYFLKIKTMDEKVENKKLVIK